MQLRRRDYDRPSLVIPALALAGPDGLLAHHGFGSFDIKDMFYIEGRILHLEWANPHIDVDIEVLPGLRLPEDIWEIGIPADNEVPVGLPANLMPLPTGSAPEIWELTMPSVERADKIELVREAIMPGELFRGAGYRGCDPASLEFRPDLMFIGRKAYALRPFGLPAVTCA
jgi:hypothetical protein